MSPQPLETVIRSATREVVIGHARPFRVIGERINPTGRRIFQEQLRAGDLSAIERDVKAQVEGGADVLDVNMGVPLTDEAELLAKAITMIQELTDLPICIDSSVVEALEAGLAAYQGRALVNSITAEDERMEQILPLVKRYDAAVIALPNDVDEIPMEPEKRLELVGKIVDVATREYGIALADIVIDPLAMPIGADVATGWSTLETMRRVRAEYGSEHDLRRVERVLRDARASRDQLHLPAHGDDRRPDQRHHGRPYPPDRRGGQGRRPGAGPRRVGHGLDRPAPSSGRGGRHLMSGPGSRSPREPEEHVDEFSLDAVRREGLLEPAAGSAGGGAAAPDAIGRVSLTFAVTDGAGGATRRSVRVPTGVTVFDSASWNGIAIDSTCGGHGTCRKCKVRVAGRAWR